MGVHVFQHPICKIKTISSPFLLCLEIYVVSLPTSTETSKALNMDKTHQRCHQDGAISQSAKIAPLRPFPREELGLFL